MKSKLVFFVVLCLTISRQATATTCLINGEPRWYPLFQIMTEVATEVAQELGLTIEVSNQRLPWMRLLHDLERGRFDILAGTYNDTGKGVKEGYSLPVTTNNIHIVVKSGNEFPYQEHGDLLGKKGVHINGATHGKKFDDYADQHLEIFSVTDVNQIFDMLIADRLDYGIGSKRAMSKLFANKEYKGKLSILPHPLVENLVHFRFSTASPCYRYIGRFNEEIQKLTKSGIIREIENKYP